MSNTYGFDFVERVPEEALVKIKELANEVDKLLKDNARLKVACQDRTKTIARLESRLKAAKETIDRLENPEISFEKGESFIDTVQKLRDKGADIIITFARRG